MPSDPRTASAPSCADCTLTPPPPTDPIRFLNRLPGSLWNRTRPTRAGGNASIFDEVYADVSIFDGDTASLDATPQWDIARIVTEEKDAVVAGWQTALALQLGLGRMTLNGTLLTGETPRATGADLDRLLAQYSIGRPYGFTDCCLWRLALLLLFKPGPVVWLLREVAELFTGVRPTVRESLSRIVLEWPQPAGGVVRKGVFWDVGFYDRTAFFDADDTTVVTDRDFFWSDDSTSGGAAFWGAPPATAAGMSLGDAIELVKPAGVVVDYSFLPLPGTRGCLGATLHRAATRRGTWGA